MAVLYFYSRCCYRAAINKLLPEGQICPLFLYSPQAMAFYIFKYLKNKKKIKRRVVVCYSVKYVITNENYIKLKCQWLIKFYWNTAIPITYMYMAACAQQQSWVVVKNSFADSCYKWWNRVKHLYVVKSTTFTLYTSN